MRQRDLFIIAVLSSSTGLYAQDNKTWSLQDCIDYALEKNIQLQQNKLSLEEADVDVKTAKASLFPRNKCNRKRNRDYHQRQQ